MVLTIGIIGNGFVGKATALLECNEIKLMVYDINPDLCRPSGTNLSHLVKCDLIFVSVPTPMNKDGSCHLKILESVIQDISKLKSLEEIIVVNRCTVPVGTSDKLNCYFMPEFLTEKNFKNDFINNPDWIFGLKGTKSDTLFKKNIEHLINTAFKNKKINSNTIHFTNNKEAELIKLFRNNYLATKISFCNEIYEFSQKLGVDYETVRKLATKDKRIGSSHTNVPGHDGKLGYGGTCFPKDTHNLLDQMEKIGIKSYIIQSIIERNEKVDRKEQDWKLNKGRAIAND